MIKLARGPEDLSGSGKSLLRTLTSHGLFTGVLLSATFLASQLASAGQTLDVSIQGSPYQLNLEATKSTATLETSARHFRGKVTGEDGSWAVVSKLNGSWQGVVSLTGELYTINRPVNQLASLSVQDSENRLLHKSSAPEVETELMTDFAGKTCGLKHRESSNRSFSEQPFGQLSNSRTSRLSYSTLCDSKVDNICLLPKLEIVADQSFQNKVNQSGNNSDDQIQLLINIVEEYYRRDFSIAFRTINVELLNNRVFTASNNADTLIADVRNKREGGQLSFEKDPYSIMHLLTGREFDDSTLGVATVRSTCYRHSATGINELQTFTNNTPNIAKTALIVAHEIGHNMGSEHDGDRGAGGNDCSSSEYIMGSTLNPQAAGFSSCSSDYVRSHISRIGDPESCLSFPVDVSLNKTTESAITVEADTPFTLRYNLTTENGFVALPDVQVRGTITAGSGRLLSARLAGTECNVDDNGQNYTCELTEPPATTLLEVEAQLSEAGVQGSTKISSEALIKTGNNLVDLNTSNNTLTTNFTSGSTNTPLPPEPVPVPLPTPKPKPTPETNKPESGAVPSKPEPETTPASSGGGGGGGGSQGPFGLLLIAVMALSHYKRRLSN
ncbi:hypothetical protein EOPP23_01410 [Endozoicomonas sp. OPT23]|uniref:M12 family metallo-peptidase n=1 Tax=Endozoicomonas sp. OPT23 TaxID=2072845 RepID=UPI00129B1943|nr:M12 family metallo-peptidase [Endozoicomonas sp. OPT23]MRI31651.1 hypothetical protein [Endozoicomonas sp. OPT23]